MPTGDDTRVTAAEAALLLGDVSRHLIYFWVAAGKLAPVGKRGRSPLYRWGDLVAVELATRLSRRSARNPQRGPLAA